MRRLGLIALCLWTLLPGSSLAIDAAQELPREALDIISSLNKRLALSEEKTDLGDGRSRSFTKRYAFGCENGKLIIGESYLGEIRDSQGIFMSFSGNYRYELPPAEVEAVRTSAEDFFEIRCQGRGQCIHCVNSDEKTWNRGQPEIKPRTTAGLVHSVTIYAGQDRENLEFAFQSLSRLLRILSQAS